MIKEHERQESVPDGHASVHAGLLDTVIEIGRERTKVLKAMKEALLRGDEDEALERARELAGLPRKRVTDSSIASLSNEAHAASDPTPETEG